LDINQSIEFIEKNGSELEKARLQSILQRANQNVGAVQGFLALQNADGGFPFGLKMGNLSTINETTVALWWMEELDLLSSPSAVKALAYLLAHQCADGSWEEDPQVAQYDLPPWIRLGDVKTRLYLSAYASYWLAAAGATHLPAFRKATHFLIRNQDESGKFYGYLHTTWIATGVFLMTGKRYWNIANKGIEALTARPLDDWSDSQVAWAVDCLSKGGLPKSQPLIEKCLESLHRRQKSDGSWASEDGESFTVSATIQVLKVFNRYGLLAGAMKRNFLGNGV
jgi:squalene cyclase